MAMLSFLNTSSEQPTLHFIFLQAIEPSYDKESTSELSEKKVRRGYVCDFGRGAGVRSGAVGRTTVFVLRV